MADETEFTDRYGGRWPDPSTVCPGQCEGIGVYPQTKYDLNRAACEAEGGRLIVVGQRGKNGAPEPDDEYVFVECPDCKGTGKNRALRITPPPPRDLWSRLRDWWLRKFRW